MAAIHLKCVSCGGKLFEDDVYWELNEKKIELGCYQCSKRVYINYKKYKDFLKKLAKTK